MNKFDFDSMLKHGFLILPKALMLQMTTDRQFQDNEIIALLTILIKVNFSETEHIGYHSKLYRCKRGESSNSYRTWSRLLKWPLKRTYNFIHRLADAGVLEIIPNEENLLHIRVCEYDKWVGDPNALKLKKKVEDEKFAIFWDEYHEVTQLNKTNLAKAQREWRKLSEKEQQLAIDMIDEYYYHQNNRKFILQASTYLANKAFLNEY